MSPKRFVKHLNLPDCPVQTQLSGLFSVKSLSAARNNKEFKNSMYLFCK